MRPIILDRSLLEQYAMCPRMGYMNKLWEIIKAMASNYEIFDYEQKMLDEAEPALVKSITNVALQSKDNRAAECGTQIHALIEKAFKECNNDLSIVPQWFVDNLPKIKPNIQPMALRHARHIADMLADFHVAIIGLEQQVSLTVYAETAERPAVIVTMRFDLLSSGNECLHVVDWKTGYKKRTNIETQESFQAQNGAFLLYEMPEYKDINTIHFWYYESMWGSKAYARFDRFAEHPRLPGLSTEKALRSRVISAVDLFVANCKDAWPLPETCAYCDVINFCPYANIDAKAIADDPQQYVDRMVVVEAFLKNMKAAATAWIKSKGELVGSKVKFTKKTPQERFTTAFVELEKAAVGESEDEEIRD